MTTQSSHNEDILDFVGSVCEADPTRIEADLGFGYVKLKSSEAERRQALQDIKNSEDILLELLRNARDAHATHVFVALRREGDRRIMIVIDDGEGVPLELKDRIFDARVTSKLETAHMDAWGMHGRGMALFSIRSNTKDSYVVDTGHQLGTSILIESSLDELGEKSDQTTFPHFDRTDAGFVMRGPKNLLRCAAEFAFQHKDEMSIYVGSFSEIAAAMREYGSTHVPLTTRTFSKNFSGAPLICRPAYAHDPQELKEICGQIGLEMSERSARRILDGEVIAPLSIFERLEQESFPSDINPTKKELRDRGRRTPSIKLHREDIESLMADVSASFSELAGKYYLSDSVEVSSTVRDDTLIIKIPLIPEDEPLAT